jgi:hypothetical protein
MGIFAVEDTQCLVSTFSGKCNRDRNYQANQSLLFLLNAACLAEKQQIPIL